MRDRFPAALVLVDSVVVLDGDDAETFWTWAEPMPANDSDRAWPGTERTHGVQSQAVGS